MKFFSSKQLLAATVAALGFAGAAQADIIEVTADISADTRWTRDNVYVIPKTVYVLPPAKLTIEPGTLIRGAYPDISGYTNSPGSLAICRGAKIIANATADDPVIFTSIDDTLVPGGVNTRPTAFTGSGGSVTNPNGDYSTTGAQGDKTNAFSHGRESGGLVLLGRTPIAYDGNGATSRPSYDDSTNTFGGAEYISLPTGSASPELTAGTQNEAGDGVGFAVIEGLAVDAVPLGASFDPDAAVSGVTTTGDIASSTSFQRGVYGGINEDDNSGIVRFMQLRYGGYPIATGIEINGLTMGAVGRGTTIEWVEVSNNADDCFEWFGGYVNCRYLAGMHCGDDGIDWDQGFSGTIQHAFIHEGGTNFGRTGLFGGVGVGAETTAGKNLSFFGPERGFELDGPEPNNSGILPRSKGWVFNATVIGNKGGSGTDTNDDGVRVRRGSSGQIQYTLFEDINNGVLEMSDNSATAGRENDTDLLDSLYFNVGTTPIGSLTATTIVTTGTAAASVTQLAAKGQLAYRGLNPSLVDEAPSGTNITARKLTRTPPARSGLTDFLAPVRYTGAMRDNNWLFGWTWAHTAELLPTTNVARPALTLAVPATNPTISFAADTTATDAADAVVYVVERSTNGVAWAPIGTVQDGSSADAPNGVLADSAGAGTITVTDTGYTYTSGTPVHYRVIAQ
jgi:hypothetical protein